MVCSLEKKRLGAQAMGVCVVAAEASPALGEREVDAAM